MYLVKNPQRQKTIKKSYILNRTYIQSLGQNSMRIRPVCGAVIAKTARLVN